MCAGGHSVKLRAITARAKQRALSAPSSMRISKLRFLLPLLLSAALAQEGWAENVLSLDRTSYTVAENAGSANIIVRLARTNSDTVTVNYATSEDTAVAGSDYTTTLGTLTFGPNDTAQLIQVPIIDDLVPENTRAIHPDHFRCLGRDD